MLTVWQLCFVLCCVQSIHLLFPTQSNGGLRLLTSVLPSVMWDGYETGYGHHSATHSLQPHTRV